MIDDRTVSQLATALSRTRGDHAMAARHHAARVAPLLSDRERESLIRSALNQIGGMGPLQHLIDDPEVSEVMVVSGRDVWVERSGALERAGTIDAAQLDLCLERVTRAAARRLDLLSPILDCVLPDGSRVCAVIPPIAVGGASLSIRRFARRIHPLSAFGSRAVTDCLEHLIATRRNVVVSGATSSGKTSLLSAVSQRFAPNERVVCIEDTAELRFEHPHVVRLQARPPTSENNGEVTLQHLVRSSLRMRPDRLVVGEVRGAEVVDMLLALSSGHTGCWSTVHATSAADSIDRIRSLIVRDAPQWTRDIIDQAISASIGAVVHMERTGNGRRRVAEIVELVASSGGVLTRPLLSGAGPA